MNPRAITGIGSILGSVYSVLPPVASLLFLSSTDYGYFSAIYLLFAFGVSLQYSLVSEAWMRTRDFIDSQAREYSSALAGLSIILLSLGIMISLMMKSSNLELYVYAFAASIGVYRVSARYFVLANMKLRTIVFVDLISIFLFLAIISIVLLSSGNLAIGLGLAWLISGLFGALLYLVPRGKFWLLKSWTVSRWKTIKPLLIDSVLMDFGAIGVPFFIALQLPVAKFATYRAVANVAFPVRILVDPLRAKIGQIAIDMLVKPLTASLIWGASIIVGLILWAGVDLLSSFESFSGTVLPTLEPFGAAVAVFGGSSLAGTIYYISARTHSSGRAIIVGRIIQTVLVVLIPLFGLLFASLQGAILGFAISGGLSSALWFGIVYKTKQRI